MNRRNAILLFGILAIICVIAIVAAAESADRGTRADETYVGDPETNCGCHNTDGWGNKIDNWKETEHAYPDGNKAGNTFNSSCTPCHVVGYDDGLGGFDSNQEWNSSHNMDFLGIQCENCHGPASGHSGDPAGINIDRDPYTACGGHGEAECHGGTRQWGTDEIHGWNASIHSPVDDLTDPGEVGSLNRYCARCKDPSNYDPEAERTDTYDVTELRGITCGDCHNPHNVTDHEAQLRWDEETICEVCHEGSHGTIRNTELSAEPELEREDYEYMDEVACVDCHMFTTPHGTPEPFAVIGHSFMPTIEACVSCHTDVYDNMPDSDYDDYETNATVKAEWDAWDEDLQEELEEWGGIVEAQQERYEPLLEEVSDLLDEVGGVISHGHLEEAGLKQAAEENGTWTTDMESRLVNASANVEVASDSSNGAHNPTYGTALLTEAKEILMSIKDDLSEGYIKGWVTDEDNAAVEGAYVNINGHGMKTDSSGMYMVKIEPGTYDVSAFIPGTEEKIATDITIHAAEVVVQNFTLAPDFDRDGTADATDTDDDNDGIPDDYESANGMNPMDATDADDDDDGDGLTNIQEYKDQTDPQDATDFKKTGAEDEEEADTTMYLAAIVVLIVVIVLLILMMAKKGGSAPAPPREEPPAEEPEEEMPEDEEM